MTCSKYVMCARGEVVGAKEGEGAIKGDFCSKYVMCAAPEVAEGVKEADFCSKYVMCARE